MPHRWLLHDGKSVSRLWQLTQRMADSGLHGPSETDYQLLPKARTRPENVPAQKR